MVRVVVSLVWSRKLYLLFPISMITMFGFEFCFASSSQRVKWLNVSRRVMS